MTPRCPQSIVYEYQSQMCNSKTWEKKKGRGGGNMESRGLGIFFPKMIQKMRRWREGWRRECLQDSDFGLGPSLLRPHQRLLITETHWAARP